MARYSSLILRFIQPTKRINLYYYYNSNYLSDDIIMKILNAASVICGNFRYQMKTKHRNEWIPNYLVNINKIKKKTIIIILLLLWK